MSTTRKSAARPRQVRLAKSFRKDLKSAKSNVKCDLDALRAVMTSIEARKPLERKYLDHPLTGRYPEQKGGHTDCRECHVGNDWLLIYRFPDDDSVDFIRTGTHADVFG